MQFAHAVLFAAVAAAAATGNQQQTICHDGTPEPTTPAPTTPEPTTPTPTTPAPTSPDELLCLPAEKNVVFESELSYSPFQNYDRAKCCATCASLPGCTAYVHEDTANDCWFRFGNVTSRTVMPGCSSAYVTNPRLCKYVSNLKYDGPILDRVLATSPEECCWYCSMHTSLHDTACNAYAYHATQECFLLSKVTTTTVVDNWASGDNA